MKPHSSFECAVVVFGALVGRNWGELMTSLGIRQHPQVEPVIAGEGAKSQRISLGPKLQSLRLRRSILLATAAGVEKRHRTNLLAVAALAGGLAATLPLASTPALAVSECGAIPAASGIYTIACGTGPFTTGITYGNTQTQTPPARFSFSATARLPTRRGRA